MPSIKPQFQEPQMRVKSKQQQQNQYSCKINKNELRHFEVERE
jgi:hypothetical protein